MRRFLSLIAGGMAGVLLVLFGLQIFSFGKKEGMFVLNVVLPM
jgi:hypothetical protein